MVIGLKKDDTTPMNKTKKREKRCDCVDGEMEDNLNLLRKFLFIF